MNMVELDDINTAVPNETFVHLPSGLLGFEHFKRFVLLTNPDEAPFSWLQVVDDASLAFLVIPSAFVSAEYQPDIPAEDVQLLGLASAEDALVYNIVTLRARGRATVNLKGPVVLNRHTMTGKQVVLANAAKYSVQHPLPLSEE